jgi:tetraprenyl-beta-curcumene synthase
MPLNRPQRSALLAAATRELGWGLRAVAHEVRGWRRQAAGIPDRGVRHDALTALCDKRGHTDGAAMFWTLPRHRDSHLLRTLVRYELLQDFLDSVTEHGASLGPENGERLYLALADALDPERPVADYYLHHPERNDGGYLRRLVEACREGCRALPGYAAVRPLLIREAHRASVLIINHRPDPVARDSGLRSWAAHHFPDEAELAWFELTAAASGWITTHALLTLASTAEATREAAEAMHSAYFPWLALTLTMLDSYADQAEDRHWGNHSYIAHYPSPTTAVRRLRETIGYAARDVLSLPDGERHGVLLGSMIALYLSKDAARARELRTATASIAAAGGTLPQMLMPALRLWRIRNRQRAST